MVVIILALVCDSLFCLPKMLLPIHVLSEICLVELSVFIHFIYILSACFLDPLLGISLIIVFFFSSNILIILYVLAITFAKKKQILLMLTEPVFNYTHLTFQPIIQ